MNFRSRKGFTVVQQKTLPGLNSTGWLLKHDATGARFAIFDNQDTAGTFFLGFRTPAHDSTGVTHIIEHSVLDGGAKYPDRDAFAKIMSGSLKTMASAGTAQDKTMYFFETANEKDFENLLSYYLDAVSSPIVLKDERIFRQEGWRYEIKDDGQEKTLMLNGVVFNEMKGVLSSTDYMLERSVRSHIYPNTIYREEAGGDPNTIPQLTWEALCQYFQNYYHPSNSYFMLSGKLDYERILDQIEEEYLNRYSYREIHAGYAMEEPWEESIYFEDTYPSMPQADPSRDSALIYAAASRTSLSGRHYFGLPILADMLCKGAEAPLKKALVEAGLAADVYMLTNTSAQEPLSAIIAQGCDASRRDDFVCCIENVLNSLVHGGLDHEKLRRTIRSHQMTFLEADCGWITKGIQLGVNIMDSWMFDEESPFLYADQDENYEDLLQALEEGWFENYIQAQFLENRHKCIGIVRPDPDGKQKYDQLRESGVEEYGCSLSVDEMEEIGRKQAELHQWMNTPQQAGIPMLTLSDMDPWVRKNTIHVNPIDRAKLLYHEIPISRIGRVTLLLPYDQKIEANARAAFLYDMLLQEAASEAIPSAALVSGKLFRQYYRIDMKFFTEKAAPVIEELQAFLSNRPDLAARFSLSDFSSCGMQQKMTVSKNAHLLAGMHAGSGWSRSAAITDQAYGMPAYLMLDAPCDVDTVKLMLSGFDEAVWKQGIALIDLLCSKTCYEAILPNITELAMRWGCPAKKDQEENGVSFSEGYVWNTNVNFNAISGKIQEASPETFGKMKVILAILMKGYLDHKIRQQGGAYHCSVKSEYDGTFTLMSFRDSRIDGTYDDFMGTVDYLKSFQPDPLEWERILVGCIGDLDKSEPPFVQADHELEDYLKGITDEMQQRARDMILECTPESLRTLAESMGNAMNNGSKTTVGVRSDLENSRYIRERKLS